VYPLRLFFLGFPLRKQHHGDWTCFHLVEGVMGMSVL
jgi:hypothetical protein